MDFPNPMQNDSDDIAQQKERIRQENVRREMERTSHDVVLVAHPKTITVKVPSGNMTVALDPKDYSMDWDGYKHTVKYGERRQLQRYLAVKYTREMKDLIINKMATIKFTELMNARAKKGEVELTPFERQAIWDRTFNTEDPSLIAQIYPQLWLGIVEEYGLDAVPDLANTGKTDYRSEEQKILDSLAKKRIDPSMLVENEPVEPSSDLSQTKANAVKGVSA